MKTNIGVISAAAPFLLLVYSCQAPVEKPEQPNILFIAVDDLRPELNCYGAKQIHSPRLDELASQGILFTEAHCNIPVCGASRASLLTGARPTRYRFTNYSSLAEKDYPGVLSLPMHFKQNSYYTISNGKVFHHQEDLTESWDENWRPSSLAPGDYVLPENIKLARTEGLRGPAYENAGVSDTAYKDGKIAAKTIRDLRRLKKMDKPFFLACGFMKPHLPFNAPTKYWSLYSEEHMQLPENRYAPENAPTAALHNFGELRNYSGIPKEGQVSDSLARTLIHGYYACVSYVDHLIGTVLDELKALDLEKNTIVILWGDHGWNLMEHGLWCKHCNFRTSLRSPLILKAPGIAGGEKSDALVEFVDIYPTLSELAGLKQPDHLEGKSFVPLLHEPDMDWKDFVICKYRDGLTIKTRDFSYTEWSRSDSAIYARMLYDHHLDLEENTNISEQDKNRELMKTMSRMMTENRGDDFNRFPSEENNN